MALGLLTRPPRVNDYVLVKGKGVFTPSEVENAVNDLEKLDAIREKPEFYPVIDFHVHPKMPDLKFLSDLRKADVSHAVILATDTDPSDVDRPEIREKLREGYSRSSYSDFLPFEEALEWIRYGLYSPSHVTDQDVADWVKDYPDIFVGFGSVNPSKSRDYVEDKLACIAKLNLKGVKLLPFSQFFNPAENRNMDLFFEHCRRTGSIILTHSGCAGGLFELLELSENSRPVHWQGLVEKYPDVPVVLAHFGAYSAETPGIWFREALKLGQKYANVYADLASVTWILEREELVKQIRESIGFDRVLFATDYPGPLYLKVSLARIVYEVKANPLLSRGEKQAVLGGNATRLLGIA
jgi:predicted TIM-barrel fold metal-dependent hydrolase